MDQIVIHGRKVYRGHAKGVALVSRDGMGTFGSISEVTGVVTERGHDIFGECIAGKILVFPYGKGSSAWASSFQLIAFNGMAPKAMLIGKVDSRTALGAVVARVPAVTDFDIDPFSVIENGDEVEVNADEGLIVVTKKEKDGGKANADI